MPAAFAGVSGVQVYVGGNSAIFRGLPDVTDSYQWIVLAFVLGLSFLLLMVVFRSLVLPIKAILMNLLSVGAAYGAVTLVFQKGAGIGKWIADLLMSPPHPTLPRVDARPIGVFDSGAGGLTVLHECLVTMPHEDFVYLGDGARLPYGPRPLDEIRRFARRDRRLPRGQGVKLVVAACNSATAAALPDLQGRLSVPVLGVIQPEAHAAVRATRNRRVGLLATEATVASGRYEALIRTSMPASRRARRLPELVPLIESDDPFGEATSRPCARTPSR